MSTTHELLQEPPLAEHFDDLEQQHLSAQLGMWIFLATEALFFGGLFCAYTVYRRMHWIEFVVASRELNVAAGAINTAVLLTSSLTMALAVRAAKLRERRWLLIYLAITIVFGAVFLGIKAFEWSEDYERGLVPGSLFTFPFRPEFAGFAEIFFLLYFLMTGLHAIHLIIGIALVATVAGFCARHQYVAQGENLVEMTGLYWHFIDVIWVFLYPLLYLIDVHR